MAKGESCVIVLWIRRMVLTEYYEKCGLKAY